MTTVGVKMMLRLFLLLATTLVLAACAVPDTAPDPGAGDPPARPVAQPGELCGGMMGITCEGAASGANFCQWQAGNMCGAADQMGVCTPVPQACTREYRPVCGCDGQTYPNACVATANRTSILHNGMCRTE